MNHYLPEIREIRRLLRSLMADYKHQKHGPVVRVSRGDYEVLLKVAGKWVMEQKKKIERK